MKCLICGEYMTSNQKICSACGKINSTCPKCKNPFSEEDMFCSECGNDLREIIESLKIKILRKKNLSNKKKKK